jgi:hypothetical protein
MICAFQNFILSFLAARKRLASIRQEKTFSCAK